MSNPEDSSTKLPTSEPTHQFDSDFQEGHVHFAGEIETAGSLEHVFDLKSLENSDKGGSLGRLGNYDLLRVLGSGGMGVVFEALDNSLGRVVALKILNRQLATSPIAKRRFLREARAAAAIKHDNVVTIHSVEEWRQCPLLVMEMVRGGSLSELIRKRGRISPIDTLKLATEISSGLAAAHAQGVIHRDIKPGNILMESNLFRAKLSDFGLARAAFDNVELTDAGRVVGTPAYMAPEQILGSEIDPRADLFSLGCVVYAMLNGHSPFHGSTYYEVSRNVTDFHPKPLHDLDPKIPRFLSDLVNKLLEKSPENRPQSAAEVSQVLTRHLAQVNQAPSDRIDRLLHEQPTDMWQNSHKPRRKFLLATVLTSLAVMVAGLLLWRPWQQPELLVAADGSAPFSKIAVALESARPGTTIRIVQPGIYQDAIVLNKPSHEGISIIGMPGVRIATAPDRQEVIRIDNVDRVTLRGLHIESADRQFGIAIAGRCAGTAIETCSIMQPENSERAAIYLYQGASGTRNAPVKLMNLDIQCGNIGVVLGETDLQATGLAVENIRITNCRIQGPVAGVGVTLALLNKLKHVEVTQNSFRNGVTAISLMFPLPGEFEEVNIERNGFVGFTNFLYAVDVVPDQGLRVSRNAIADTTNLLRFDRIHHSSSQPSSVEQLPKGISGNWWKADREVADAEVGKAAELVTAIPPENLDPTVKK